MEKGEKGEQGRFEGGQNFPEEFSVFVRNIPGSLDRFGLKGIFEKIGRVSDTYIPNRDPRWNQKRFGFVRYRTLWEVKACIQRLNGTWVRGCRIQVAMAKPKRSKQGKVYGKISSPLQIRQKKKGAQRMLDSRSDRSNQEVARNLHCIKGKQNMINEEWLQRTLVCTTKEPRDLATLSSTISNGGLL